MTRITPGPYDCPVDIKPCKTIKDVMNAKGVDIATMAERMNVSVSLATKIVNGKVSISPIIAKWLESALDISANFWLNIEQAYWDRKRRKRQ